ncbi:MAG: GAF domain-containing protein [Prochlorothrix sp.]
MASTPPSPSAAEPAFSSIAHKLHLITNRIRQSLEIDAILGTTVQEVQRFLQIDRVKVYQFQADGHGVVQAEALMPNHDPKHNHPYRLPSLLGLHFPADDIPLFAREVYLRQRQRTIVNIQTQEIGISPLVSPDTGHAVDATDINYRVVDPCHLEYLRTMGVQASLVLPIVVEMPAEGQPIAIHDPLPLSLGPNQVLWGLLVAHHSEPYEFSQQSLDLLQGVVDQVEVAIAQSECRTTRSQPSIEFPYFLR